MGRVPIMNQETIKNRATLALTTMAAKLEEGNNTKVPSEDTLAAIDDVLSICEGMEFYGRKTKTYINNKDPLSKSFCTVPVKYEFRDKDSRISAETVLQEKCGIHSTTPYPAVVRECIKQVVEKVKADYPSNQVKVNVDCNTFSLKVSRREKSEGSSNKWESFDYKIPLPALAFDVDLRKVPDNFVMDFLPPGKEKGMKGSPVKKILNMDVTPEGVE
jgi:hypothetical protein